jgi:tryptophan synthase alpha chain
MSRIADIFQGKKAFIPFITAGDPNLDMTEKLVVEMARSGADLIELGIPFSDPVAEGIVIQRADERALAAGTSTDRIFDSVRKIRLNTDVPLAFMTYMNPVFTYGVERFLRNCHESGVDAIIVPDVPFEEREELLPYCLKYNVEMISLIAPTSKDRICMIAREARGFVYCVSSMGVTGVRSEINTDISTMINLVRSVQDIPCAIGFGISTPDQAKAMAEIAEGVIVGSAIVKLIEAHGVNCIDPVCDYIKVMKNAINAL